MTTSSGFSILELAVVVTVLSILAGISLPAFFDFVKSSRIDAAKAQLNSLLAECLKNSRLDSYDLSEPIDNPNLSTLEGLGYRIDNKSNSCEHFSIEPSDPGDKFTYTLGFRVGLGSDNNIRVEKFAIPSDSSSALGSCKLWAGANCSASSDQQQKWEEEAKLAEAKKLCNDEFYTFLNNGSKGQKNVWDDASQSCSRAQWVLEGTRYTSKDAYNAAFTAKVGKECAASLAAYANNNPPNGPYKNEACDIDTYFLNGSNLESSDPAVYQAKQKEYNDLQCDAAEQAWLSDGTAGAFTWPAGLSCIAKWKCPVESNRIFTDINSFNTSSCAAPTECVKDKRGRCISS